MRIRHRIPSVFNLSMVDVFCCALGCVILLWLINLREARDENQRQADRLRELELERSTLSDKTTRQAAEARDLEDNLRAARDELAGLRNDLGASEKRGALYLARADELARKLKDLTAVAARVPALEADLKTTRSKLAEEDAMARGLEAALRKKTEEVTSLNKDLQALLLSRKNLESSMTAKERELALALAYKDKLAVAEAKVTDLEKGMAGRAIDLAAATRAVEALQREKDALQARALRRQAEVENRFAGITLTGRRVVFLVDMSGSMDHVDPRTPAPGKWPEVCKTVARIMRSLQDLEKFQVVLFSTGVSWPLGHPEEWLDFDPRTSAETTERALTAVRPRGGTHLYDGMRAAFSLRDQGLDTVYLLSDGLPNHGPGVTDQQRRALQNDEVRLGNLLGRHILKTLKSDWNRDAKVRVNSIGFFYESPDLGAFLWALSRANDGSFVGMSKP